MAEHYYTVGTHGPPTKETAPHGYMWRNRHTPESKGKWVGPTNVINIAHADTEWYPLPAPPAEQAPPPEPVKRWVATWDHDGWLLRHATPDDAYSSEDATSAADALNALDRDGVAWGPGRPMSELPDDGLVLVQMSSGVPYTFYIRKADYIATHRNTYECWWPLPGEAQ